METQIANFRLLAPRLFLPLSVFVFSDEIIDARGEKFRELPTVENVRNDGTSFPTGNIRLLYPRLLGKRALRQPTLYP